MPLDAPLMAVSIMRAAKRFDELLHSDQRPVLEQSIKDIAAGVPLL